ncbi:hypothetical protein EBE87_28475 [Pseudoroseomonas wenyumeiae]|uniref:Transposase n=1 Tax=Teichococcus wenyumeiae TaxID=2478470 RepID=A0A3A9IV60_9PROT|nr:hypothetical protein D6Z83_28475 [Pseudoroseomonas wenyumeiae]RMI13116.1 hypothetical protein EBE87_28475 [Pseudoroseomonas wenyumeiae]
MVDVHDDASGRGYRRVEVLTGPGRRRRRSEEAKAQIVAETLAPGAVIAEVARRWQICSQQVFTWRREMRHSAPPSFVLIVAEPSVAPRESTPSPCIEIQRAGGPERATAPPAAEAEAAAVRAEVGAAARRPFAVRVRGDRDHAGGQRGRGGPALEKPERAAGEAPSRQPWPVAAASATPRAGAAA